MTKRRFGFVEVRLGGQRLYLDTQLLAACSGLLILGFIMVTSATLHKEAADALAFAKRQLVHIALGFGLAYVLVQVPLELWRRHWLPLLFGGVLMLLIVLIPGIGKEVNGSTRWLNLGIMRIQVSEIFKLIAIIYTASYIARRLDNLRASGLSILVPLLVLAAAGVLLVLEPDFGAAVVIMATALIMLFLAGTPIWSVALLTGVGVAGGALLILAKGYRTDRIFAFLDPWGLAQGKGYQVVQALMAFGRGEWLGVGLGSGVQKLGYLPEAHTDYLLSVIGEELGLVGTWTVVVLFTVMIWRAFTFGRAADRAELLFGAYVAYGIGAWLAIQSFINMAVNLGMLPPKGLTLPLMSYGGGSMIVSCAALALLFRVRSEVIAVRLNRQREHTRW